ncbi:MAG: MFS transporter [Rhodospirillales bacterium]|nr:MFS transporter [Rhodospirillales bacterium]
MTGAPDSFAARVACCFLPFAGGYFLSYAFRAVNAAIGPDLSRELALDPATYGAITSAYFATFALAQLPLGVALDRWGPRRTEATLLCAAALGAAIFAIADTTRELLIGRALIGLGVSSCLMAAFKANTLYWPIQRLPLANGLLMGFGGLGAASATIPVDWLLSVTDWRTVIAMMAVATLAVAAGIWFVSPDPPPPTTQSRFSEQVRGIVDLLRSGPFWRVTALTGISHGTYLAYQTLWAGPWLRDVAGLDRTQAALGMALVTGSMAFSYPILGALADRLAARGISTMATFGFYAAAFIVLQVPLAAGWTGAPLFLWAAFGFVGCGTVVGYAALTQQLPTSIAGRANAAINLVVFFTAFAVQWSVGAILNIYGQAPETGHTIALSIATGLQVLAWLWFIRGSGRHESRRHGNAA